MISFEQVKNNQAIRTYIMKADESLGALGYTEHSFAHVTKVSETAVYILSTLGYPERDIRLARIAGYMHDIGNLVNRDDHARRERLWHSEYLTIWALSRMRSQQ